MNVPRKFLRDGGAQKPECLHCHFSAIHDGGSAGGVPPKVISTVLSVFISWLL